MGQDHLSMEGMGTYMGNYIGKYGDKQNRYLLAFFGWAKVWGKSSISGCFFVCEGFFLVKFDYPLVICYIAIENGHRNTGFSH